MLLAGALFGVFGLGLGHEALTNDRGLLLNGVIELETSGATVFYWILTLVCLGFVVCGLGGVILGMTSRRTVVLGDNSLSTPGTAWSRRNTDIPLSNITDLAMQTLHGQQFLTIFHIGGKLSLVRSMFSSPAEFEEFAETLRDRLDGMTHRCRHGASPGQAEGRVSGPRISGSSGAE